MNITIADEMQTRPGLTNFADQLLVAGPVEDGGSDFPHVNMFGFRNICKVPVGGFIEADSAFGFRADHDFVHVAQAGRQFKKAILFGQGNNRNRVRGAVSQKPGAINCPHRYVHFGAGAGADRLAGIKISGLAFLAFTNNYPAFHIHRAQSGLHGLGGSLADRFYLASPHYQGCRKGRRFRCSY